MIRVNCATSGCPATAHVGADGLLPQGWSVDGDGRHRCPRHAEPVEVQTARRAPPPTPNHPPVWDLADMALRMPRGPVSHARGRVRLRCPDCLDQPCTCSVHRTRGAGREASVPPRRPPPPPCPDCGGALVKGLHCLDCHPRSAP